MKTANQRYRSSKPYRLRWILRELNKAGPIRGDDQGFVQAFAEACCAKIEGAASRARCSLLDTYFRYLHSQGQIKRDMQCEATNDGKMLIHWWYSSI
jgi:hypothetical protein